MIYLSNAFSLNMISSLDEDAYVSVQVRRVRPGEIPRFAESAIGHLDTARVVSGILGWDVPANRVNVSLEMDDVLYVAQYKGPRLQEGATRLPAGATLEFFEVKLEEHRV